MLALIERAWSEEHIATWGRLDVGNEWLRISSERVTDAPNVGLNWWRDNDVLEKSKAGVRGRGPG